MIKSVDEKLCASNKTAEVAIQTDLDFHRQSSTGSKGADYIRGIISVGFFLKA
jgi:hypothetical protein